MKNVANAKVTLTDYDLTNPQIFSRQLNLVDDIATVRVINKSLETLRSMQNMLISQESPEAKDIVDIPEISNLIKAARNRLDLLSYEQNSNDRESVKQLLNAALENIHFSFYKKGEEELELQEQYKQSVAHTRNQLNACVDPDDPEYRSILADFLALFKKKEISPKELNIWMTATSIIGGIIIYFFQGSVAPMLRFAMIASFLTTPFFALLNYLLVTGENKNLAKWLKALSILGLIFLFGFAFFFIYALVIGKAY